MDGQTVRFSRPGLVEEYSVSMDGVRQDFVVTEKPAGAGHLQVRLGVAGAKVEAMVGGGAAGIAAIRAEDCLQPAASDGRQRAGTAGKDRGGVRHLARRGGSASCRPGFHS